MEMMTILRQQNRVDEVATKWPHQHGLRLHSQSIKEQVLFQMPPIPIIIYFPAHAQQRHRIRAHES
jgi:hypothetical protein